MKLFTVLPIPLWEKGNPYHPLRTLYWLYENPQGGRWPDGCDPALHQSRSPSARSMRTLSWATLPVTRCHPTRAASLSCPTTAASKETCPMVGIRHRWRCSIQAVWPHHGNPARGKRIPSMRPTVGEFTVWQGKTMQTDTMSWKRRVLPNKPAKWQNINLMTR